MKNTNVYKWSAIDRVCNAVMTFAGNIIFARLLDPTDFGLLAMVSIFVAIASNVSSCGMSDGLIHKLTPTQKDYSTVFTFNTLLGVCFSILFIAFSGFIARLFGHEQLKGIMIAIGICFFFQSMSFVQEARLRKLLDMKKIAKVKLSATFTALTLGIVLVELGFSYWGLVSARIFMGFFLFCYFVIATRWFPKFAFFKKSFHEMFGFGFNLMLAYIINQLSRTINATILGKFAPASTAGIYSQAQKLEEVPFGITESVFDIPFFPVISNESDRDRRISLAREMHQIIMLVNISLGMFLILIAYPAIELVYGEKWLEAAPIFQILVVFGVLTAIKYFYQTILKVKGKPHFIRNLNLIEFAIQVSLLFLFYDKGIVLIALTQVIAVGLIFIVYVYLFKKYTDTPLIVLAGSMLRQLLAPLAALAVTYVLFHYCGLHMPVLLELVVRTIAYIAVFFGFLFAFNRDTFYAIKEFIKLKTSK